jgi:hypothetical protein
MNSEKNVSQSHFIHLKSHIDLGVNLSLHGDRPVTKACAMAKSTYISNSIEQNLSREVNSCLLVKKFPAFYETQ